MVDIYIFSLLGVFILCTECSFGSYKRKVRARARESPNNLGVFSVLPQAAAAV